MSARDLTTALPPSIDSNLAGHVSIGALLRAQEKVPHRTRLGRIFGRSPLTIETRPLYQRVVGEIEVGVILDSLGPEWVVLHAIPKDLDSAEIDHLVIGPCGIFAIATKNHRGLDIWASERTFMAEGIRYPYIRNLEYEIGAAEQLLSAALGGHVEISGILAVVTPKSLEVPDQHRDVAVVPASELVDWIDRRPQVFSKDEVASIATAARLASTWFPGDSCKQTPGEVRTAFDTLQSTVLRAWRVQLAWVIGASIVMIGGFVFVTYSILMNAFAAFGR